MSANPISLKSKPVIAVVLALLAVVVVVNVAVFKPGLRPSRRAEVRVQAAQPLPVDLYDFRDQTVGSRENLAAWSSAATPALARDPFDQRRAAEVIIVPDATTIADDDAPAEDNPLVCEAVLLGSGSSVAVISGKSYRIGEVVGEYQVVAVGALGTKLTHISGTDLFLSVDSDRGSSGRSRIVTKSNMMGGLDKTSLVEHARGERK